MSQPERPYNAEHLDAPPEHGEFLSGLPVIEFATVAAVERYLTHGQYDVVWPGQYTHDHRRSDPNHPLGQWWSMATTETHSAVLYDAGAAFCSPTVAFDEAGNAIHCHSSPLGFGDFKDLEFYFFPELKDWLGAGRISLVMGGSNVDVTEEGQRKGTINPIDWAIDGIKERLEFTVPGADFYALISKQYENQRPTHPCIPEQTTVRGFVFIPQYLASDRRNHVLALGDDGQSKAIFAALSRHKRYID